MIEVNNLVKRYGDHTAVDHLSFKIEKGKIYGFLGPNGAGKSTTMNMITGYIASTEGTVIILDEPTVGLDPKQIIEIRDLIKSLKKKHTVILSSHILSEVSAVCDYVLIISHGKLVASDTPENLGKLAEGSNTLNLLVKGDKDHIRIALGQISDIKDIKIEDAKEEHAWNVMLSTKEDMDIREEVFFKMADAHCPILEMQSKKVSLEEIFLELTEDDKKKKNEKETDKKEGENK